MKFLIVDDERGARCALRQILGNLGEPIVVEAADIQLATSLLDKDQFDVAFIDLRLGGASKEDGLELVRRVAAAPETLAVVVSGSSDIASIRSAMRLGAHDYLLKDELCEDLVRPVVEAIRRRRQLEREVIELRALRSGGALGLIGSSEVMQRLRQTIQRAAVSDLPVLITGPTGSGKELVARALHQLGAHPEQPLLDLNCGAFPENLIESQLFGHERGAFTGADRKQEGYLRATGAGTLFLDEIAELPLELQSKLLRVLEAGTFWPIGATSSCRFEGRVVAATHADLAERAESGLFRWDLVYRLRVLDIRVPSLSEHPEDIPALVAHFASQLPTPLQFTADAVESLAEADWPGNVRQLRNVIDRLAVFSRDTVVTSDAVAEALRNGAESSRSRVADLAREILNGDEPDKLAVAENALMAEALRRSNGNKTAAARLLGIHRKVVERRLA